MHPEGAEKITPTHRFSLQMKKPMSLQWNKLSKVTQSESRTAGVRSSMEGRRLLGLGCTLPGCCPAWEKEARFDGTCDRHT